MYYPLREPTVTDPLPVGNCWWKRVADWIADALCWMIEHMDVWT